jgi:tRNA dimethylallyltransferase
MPLNDLQICRLGSHGRQVPDLADRRAKGLAERGFAAKVAIVSPQTSVPAVICIVGPTASGKSALAMELARQLKGEILCVDSMTIYRGMDIGTAKPTHTDQNDVRHWGLDLVEPTQEFTVARFVEYADAVIADCAQRGVPLIAVGGTPLYFVSLFKGLFEGPGADEELRHRLRSLGGDALHARLREVDPVSALRIHANDTKRLVRALEVFELTGKPISAQQTEWSGERSGQDRHPAVWFGMHWEKEELNRRINSRARAMVETNPDQGGGWVEECRALRDKYTALGKTAGEAAGYRELFAYLDGKQSLSDALEAIKISTRQLARRQMKWFRRFQHTTWIDGQADRATQAHVVLQQLRSRVEK